MNKKPLLLLTAASLFVAACGDDGPMTPEDRQIPIEDLLDGAVVITRDPNGVTPLTAEATFSTEVPVSVRVEVLGPEPLLHEFPETAMEHTIAILGLYPGVENRVELRLTDAEMSYGVDTLEISTDPLPDFYPSVEIVAANLGAMEPGWTLSSLSIGENGISFNSQPMMFDANGDVRWYMDLDYLDEMVFMVERLANGNLVTGRTNAIFEFDMLGAEVNRWDIPGYSYHHDVIEKPDGNLIVAVDKAGIGTVEDHIIELDRTSGAIVNEWDLRQVLDVNRRDYSANPVDWFHMNAVWYSESDDALIISGRNQAVVKVTMNNELVWILAPHRGWGPAGPNADGHETSDFLLTAIDPDGNAYPDPVQQGDEDAPDFRWPWGQHAPMILPNGNVFLFDNGLRRNFAADGPTFSRGVEYAIDESLMTVRQIWQYGEERGDEFYSAIISDVDYLPATGNRLVMPGIVFGADPLALVTEVSHPGNELVFEAKIHFKNMLSSGTLAWGDFDLVYRSERLPLYP